MIAEVLILQLFSPQYTREELDIFILITIIINYF